MQEMRVRSLGGEEPLEKEMATHSIFMPRKSHRQRSLGVATVHGVQRVGHNLVTKQQQLAGCQVLNTLNALPR